MRIFRSHIFITPISVKVTLDFHRFLIWQNQRTFFRFFCKQQLLHKYVYITDASFGVFLVTYSIIEPTLTQTESPKRTFRAFSLHETLPFKLTSVIQFCENGTDDGPYAVTLEDVSAYIISLHEIGYITSTLWSTLSIIQSIILAYANNIHRIWLIQYKYQFEYRISGFCCRWLIDSRRIQCNLSYAKCLYIQLNNAYIHINRLPVHINICECDKYHLNNIIQSQSLHFYS